MRFFLIVIIIIFSCVAGCGPTEEQKKEIYKQGYDAGWGAARTLFYNKGKIDGHKLAMAKCDTLVAQSFIDGNTQGYTKGVEDGYEQAQKEEFLFQITEGLRLSWTKAIVILILSFFGLLVFSVLRDLFFGQLRGAIKNYIREKRWKMESTFSQRRRIEVEKEKWIKEKEEVKSIINSITGQIESIETNNERTKKFIDKGMPEKQQKKAEDLIHSGKNRIEQLDHVRKGLKKSQNGIKKILNGLDFELYVNNNVSSLDIQTLLNESEELRRKINLFKKYDTGDFNVDIYDEFFFHHGMRDEFFNPQNSD